MKGVGSALRMVFRPLELIGDAFDFLLDEEHITVSDARAETDAAVQRMRSAANSLNDVAKRAIEAAHPTAREVIMTATDEAAAFDA